MAVNTDKVASEIRVELRSIIRQIEDARSPVSQFWLDESPPEGGPRFYVMFDSRPRKPIRGLKCSVLSLKLPDERITDAYFSLAKSIWQLKDRLRLWVKANSLAINIETEANGCKFLQMCADLANWKKHGKNDNRSGMNPIMDLVTFDTSKSGSVEFFYEGNTKYKELIVSNPVSIPYRIDITNGTNGQVIGNALDIMITGFRSWFHVIHSIKVLEGGNPEAEHLRSILFIDGPTGSMAL